MTSCGTCGEWLPHACAPVITIKRPPFGRKSVTIEDRSPAVTAQDGPPAT